MKYCSQCKRNVHVITDYDDVNDEQYDDCCPTCGADLSNSEFKLLEPTPPVVTEYSKSNWLTRNEYLKKEAEDNDKQDAFIEGILARYAEQGIIIIESLNIKS